MCCALLDTLASVPGTRLKADCSPLTLIKCPHCGHAVLSVASHCPACSRALGQTFLGPEHQGELAQCRSCGHPVRSGTKTCPHCGIARPAQRPRPFRTALPALVAVILAALALALGEQLLDRTPRASPQTTTTRARPKPLVARAIEPPPAATRDSVVAKPAVADSPGFQTAWTTMWVNVRQRPTNQAPVLRVLRPGTQIRGTIGQWGWWSVRLGSDSLGYVAGELLRAARPGDSIPTVIR